MYKVIAKSMREMIKSETFKPLIQVGLFRICGMMRGLDATESETMGITKIGSESFHLNEVLAMESDLFLSTSTNLEN